MTRIRSTRRVGASTTYAWDAYLFTLAGRVLFSIAARNKGTLNFLSKCMQHAFQSYWNALISARGMLTTYRRRKLQEKLIWTIIQTWLLALPSYCTTSKPKYMPWGRLAIIPIYHLRNLHQSNLSPQVFLQVANFWCLLYTLISSTPLLSELYRGYFGIY